MELHVNLPGSAYPIRIEKGSLNHITDWIDPKRATMVVTDDGIPQKWVAKVLEQLPDASLFVFKAGEASKSLQTYEQLLLAMSEAGLNRKSQVVALGGGVVGDLAGFAAASYMRGVDFYNIPTTALAQVDSSVGGKTAVDLGGIKNIVGAFWQPKAVIIDPDVLETLDPRQTAAGLAEALKMALCFDKDLVDAFEKEPLDLEEILAKAVDLKRRVVEEDEKEAGLRKVLNFGHTIGHAIEGSAEGEEFEYLHGECVAAGILYFIEDPALKKRVQAIEETLNLPQITRFDKEKARGLLRHDKKGNVGGIDCVVLDGLETFRFERLSPEAIDARLERNVYEKLDRQ